MKNFIRQLKIENFKSIKSMELECERINIFIGEPNTGKSNILEALSLFCAPYSKRKEKFLSEFIRYERLYNLYHFLNIAESVLVKCDVGEAKLESPEDSDFFELTLKIEGKETTFKQGINVNGDVENLKSGASSPVKKYHFLPNYETGTNGIGHLSAPYGENIFNIVDRLPALKKIIGNSFKEQGLDFVLDMEFRKFAIQRQTGDVVYKTPYSLVSDTFQRYIFHLAAIFSNKDSILLLEEPESHLFPPYIQQIANRIMDSTENQFFIATHSHYLLNSIVEESREVAVFIVTYEDYETKVKRLSEDELRELLGYGLDIFYNLNSFQHEPQP